MVSDSQQLISKIDYIQHDTDLEENPEDFLEYTETTQELADTIKQEYGNSAYADTFKLIKEGEYAEAYQLLEEVEPR